MSFQPDVVTICFPQWQGGGERGRPIAAGAAVLASRFQRIDQWVDVSPSFDPTPTDQIVSKHVLVEQLRNAVACLTQSASRVLLVGGDCATDLALISWSAQRYGDGLAVLYLDAHADSNTPQSSPSGALHGMVVSHAVGEGDADVRALLTTSIEPKQVLFVGVRNEDPPEKEWTGERGIARVPATASARDVLEHKIVQSASAIHLHLDLDVLDPSEFPHTTYPTSDGMSIATVVELIRALTSTGQLVSVAVTESLAEGNEVHKLDPIVDALSQWRAT
jgi:arginase